MENNQENNETIQEHPSNTDPLAQPEQVPLSLKEKILKKKYIILIALLIFFLLFLLSGIYYSLNKKEESFENLFPRLPISSDSPQIPNSQNSTPSKKDTSLNMPTSAEIATPTTTNNPTIRVMTISYNPAENGKTYADTYYGHPPGKSWLQTEKELWDRFAVDLEESTNNTFGFEIVHHYTSTVAPSYLNGKSYNLETFSKCIPNRPEFDGASCENQKWQFDYERWIKSEGMCNLINEHNVDMIWLTSLPFMMTYENFMIGPTAGYDVNGIAIKDTTCNNHVVVVTTTYERLAQPYHVMAHMVEATMRYLTQDWLEEEKNKYWENFSAIKLYRGQTPQEAYCGNGHFPSNASKDYLYDSDNFAKSTCMDWPNFPNLKGESETINCTAWGCSDEGWQKYWFKNIPHSKGDSPIHLMDRKETKAFPNNWWSLLLFPDKAIEWVNSK